MGYLLACVFGVIVYLIAAFMRFGPLRVPLGLFVLLFAPGYGLAAVLFGTRTTLPWTVLFALSVAFSVVVNVLVGVGLLVASAGLPPTVFGLTAIITLALGLFVVISEGFARSSVARPPSTKVQTAWGLLVREFSLPGFSPGQRAIAYSLLLAIFIILGSLAYAASAPNPTSHPDVVFAVTGPGGSAANLPRTGTISGAGFSSPLTAYVTITNNATAQVFQLHVQSSLSSSATGLQVRTPWSLPLNLSIAPLTSGTEWFTFLPLQPLQTLTLPVSFVFDQASAAQVPYLVHFILEQSNGVPIRSVGFSVTISSAGYAVSFAESGLPPPVSWSVTLSPMSTGGNWSATPSTTVIQRSNTAPASVAFFNVANGSYVFRAFAVGYNMSAGILLVSGGNVSRSVTMTPLPKGSFGINVFESGIPASGTVLSTSWNATLSNSTSTSTLHSDLPILSFNRVNGSYNLSVSAPPPYHSVTPLPILVAVNGTARNHTVQFDPPSGGASTLGAGPAEPIRGTARVTPLGDVPSTPGPGPGPVPGPGAGGPRLPVSSRMAGGGEREALVGAIPFGSLLPYPVLLAGPRKPTGGFPAPRTRTPGPGVATACA
jgi:hypothetical protein